MLDVPRCRHCGRPENRHGKYLAGCMKDGKAMKTSFELAKGATKTKVVAPTPVKKKPKTKKS